MEDDWENEVVLGDGEGEGFGDDGEVQLAKLGVPRSVTELYLRLAGIR